MRREDQDSSVENQQIEPLHRPQHPTNHKLLQYQTKPSKNIDAEQTHVYTHYQALAILATLLAGLTLISYFVNDQDQFCEPETAAQLTAFETNLPRILWIYTRTELEAMHATPRIFATYINETALSNNYEVRIVNSWSAYDWLSKSTIAFIGKTIQNTKIDQTVDNLLVLALIIEHGGIMVRHVDTVFVNGSFTWLEQMFAANRSQEKQWGCGQGQAEVVMPDIRNWTFGVKYYEHIIAARPQSTLLKQAFDLLSNVILTGTFPMNQKLGVLFHNNYTNINHIPESISKVISYLALTHRASNPNARVCERYGLQNISKPTFLDIAEHANHEGVHLLFKARHTHPINLLINADTDIIRSYLRETIRNMSRAKQIPHQSIIYKVLTVPGNKEVFFDQTPEPEREFCLLVPNDVDLSDIKNLYSRIKQQQYSNWKLVLFAKDIELKIEDERVIILPTSSQVLRNIEVAVTQHCQQRGYVVLLNKNQNFNTVSALKGIAQCLKPRNIMGAALDLQYNQNIRHATPKYINFSRSLQGIKDPEIDTMEGIINHFRIFSVMAFRYLPQFDLRDSYGKYYTDRIIFQISLLEMINSPKKQLQWEYIYKKYHSLWNVPRTAILIPPAIRIITDTIDTVDRSQLQRTRAQHDVEPLPITIDECVHWGVPFSKLMVFNPGKTFIPMGQLQGPDLIPKIIHQIWLGGKMSVAQEYFLSKARKLYPDYQFRVWGEENITRELFPQTHDMIVNLIDFHKNRNSPFSKLATVTDIMRHEILYHQGGFWRDAGMNLFKPVFNQFLKYKLVIGAERSLRHRWNQGMCFFANAPKVDNLWRITGYRNVNRMQIYSDVALNIAGPFDFRQVVNGMEEYSPDILMLPFQIFYPGQIDRPPFDDLCTVYKKDLKEGQQQKLQFVFQHKGCFLLPNCEEKYPYAFGLDHNCFGVSWRDRKK